MWCQGEISLLGLQNGIKDLIIPEQVLEICATRNAVPGLRDPVFSFVSFLCDRGQRKETRALGAGLTILLPISNYTPDQIYRQLVAAPYAAVILKVAALLFRLCCEPLFAVSAQWSPRQGHPLRLLREGSSR